MNWNSASVCNLRIIHLNIKYNIFITFFFHQGYTDYSAAFYTYDVLLTISAVTVLMMPLGAKVPADNLFRDLVNIMKMPHVILFIFFLFALGNFWGFIESFLFLYLKELGAPNYLLGELIIFWTHRHITLHLSLSLVGIWPSPRMFLHSHRSSLRQPSHHGPIFFHTLHSQSTPSLVYLWVVCTCSRFSVSSYLVFYSNSQPIAVFGLQDHTTYTYPFSSAEQKKNDFMDQLLHGLHTFIMSLCGLTVEFQISLKLFYYMKLMVIFVFIILQV